MCITLAPLHHTNQHFSDVIQLYKSAFTTAKNIPTWLLNYKLKNGKPGFNIIYSGDTWVGLVYTSQFKDIVYIHFLAITENCRSAGYGSKVIEALKNIHSNKRITLNIEVLDENQENYQQRVKRKAFYIKNQFINSGYTIKEPDETLEMLIYGGEITKDEIEALYSSFYNRFIGFFLKPKVIKT